MAFALSSWILICLVAFAVGGIQGYIGGRLDFLGQRVTEIWHALPVLYVLVFLASLFTPNLLVLTGVWVAFCWIPVSGYVRAEVLRIRKLDYITAARASGASHWRILFRHCLPNALTPLITFSPFLITTAVVSLASLDYLGLGIPPPTPSWGELLREGKENLSAWWLVFFPFLSLFATLLSLAFIAEGVRSSLGNEPGKPVN
jgi:microcin C transport system permease protein